MRAGVDPADRHADPVAPRVQPTPSVERVRRRARPVPYVVDLAGDAMSIVSSYTPRKGRNVELALVIGAVAIVALAYVNVELAVTGSLPPSLATLVFGYLGVAVGFHLVLRWRASYADPLMLPIVTLLNGLGLVMIHRLDLANGRSLTDGVALRHS